MRSRWITGIAIALAVVAASPLVLGSAAPAEAAQHEEMLAPGDACKRLVASVTIETIGQIMPKNVRNGETLWQGESAGTHVHANDIPNLVKSLMTAFNCP